MTRKIAVRRRFFGLGRIVSIDGHRVERSFWGDRVVSIGPHKVKRSLLGAIVSVGATTVQHGVFRVVRINGIPRNKIAKGTWEAAILDLIRDEARDRSARNNAD